MSGIWTLDPATRPREPKAKVKSHLWKWDEVYDGLLQARERIDVGRGSAERRAIRLVNPGLQETALTTHTMLFALQILNPGEIAPPHRHSMAALRFILQGKGAYTIVEGEKFVMEAGDLILTPQGAWHEHANEGTEPTWHEHANEGTEPMIWLDGLDVPLIESLQVAAMEPYEGKGIPPKENPYAASGYGMMRPVASAKKEVPRPLHYRWRDVYPALQRRGEVEPHPITGGATLPTLSCWLQMLRPGERTQVHRHTSTTIYHAFRGSGTTIINGAAIHWDKGDTFVVPLWSWHEHANGTNKDEAILFSMHDTPVLNAFGLYREEQQGATHLGL
jgi:gentisate 1,2-dioxygenase